MMKTALLTSNTYFFDLLRPLVMVRFVATAGLTLLCACGPGGDAWDAQNELAGLCAVVSNDLAEAEKTFLDTRQSRSTDFQIVRDSYSGRGYAIGLHHSQYASGKSFVNLFDSGDTIKFTFRIPSSGADPGTVWGIGVRVRSGDRRAKRNLVSGYQVWLDGVLQFGGDSVMTPRVANVTNQSDASIGGGYWATLRIAPMALDPGAHVVKIKANRNWLGFDAFELMRYECEDASDPEGAEGEPEGAEGEPEGAEGDPEGAEGEPEGADVGTGGPFVTVNVGASFQQLNNENPAGTRFLVRSGRHLNQRVFNPKEGNEWVGEDDAILDGLGAVTDAFGGVANNVTIRNLRIQNYRDNGIKFTGGTGVVVDNVEVYDTGSGNGEANGAIAFSDMSDIRVVNCHVERVSSGILPTNCRGPIVIDHNTGVNIGRNMIQLDTCSGRNIRVTYNSMERIGSYLRPGAHDVEDWISVFATMGEPDDYAEISFNRARGHGVSGAGSFIMLGDRSGRYQRAQGNIGVSPGQVGIGIAGGQQIEVLDNRMYSDSWFNSNVAFYSAQFGSPKPGMPTSCSHHTVIGNSATWTNRDGISNLWFTNSSCSNLTMEGNAFPAAPDLTPAIWDSWAP